MIQITIFHYTQIWKDLKCQQHLSDFVLWKPFFIPSFQFLTFQSEVFNLV